MGTTKITPEYLRLSPRYLLSPVKEPQHYLRESAGDRIFLFRWLENCKEGSRAKVKNPGKKPQTTLTPAMNMHQRKGGEDTNQGLLHWKKLENFRKAQTFSSGKLLSVAWCAKSLTRFPQNLLGTPLRVFWQYKRLQKIFSFIFLRTAIYVQSMQKEWQSCQRICNLQDESGDLSMVFLPTKT